MPKILSYTPPWLSRPSPGSQAFTRSENRDRSPQKRGSHQGSPARESSSQAYYGPRRLLARRGTEIFVVVENQIRWLDMRRVKNAWEEQAEKGTSNGSPQQQDEKQSRYRVCDCLPIYATCRLTLTDSECASLSADTPANSISVRQLSRYPDRAYGAYCNTTRLVSSGKR
jgi:hypothetical protein